MFTNSKSAVRGARLTLAALVLLWPTGARGQQTPSTGAEHPDNYYAASQRVEIASPMGGDVIVAGRSVEVSQPVAGDIMAVGWHVRLTAPAHDDVRVAAGDVTVNAPVAGDLTLGGGEVTTGPLTRVSGRTWLTGNTVLVDGTFERDVHVAGASVQIAGEIRQPIQVVAEKLEILPSARVLAPLTYKGSSEAVVGAGAVLDTPIRFERIAAREARSERAWPAVSTFFFAAHLLVAGLLALFLVPRFEPSVVGVLRAQPVRSLVAGFTLLVTIPAAVLVLMLSVLALPVGLALGMFYFMALFAGVIATAFFVGDFEARLFKAGQLTTRGQHALLLLAGVLTLAMLRLLLGGIVVFVSVLFGLGALTLWLYQMYSQPTPTVTT